MTVPQDPDEDSLARIARLGKYQSVPVEQPAPLPAPTYENVRIGPPGAANGYWLLECGWCFALVRNQVQHTQFHRSMWQVLG